MDEKQLLELLGRLKRGQIQEEHLLAALKHMPFSHIGQARIDHHRGIRTGFSEVVFGQGKDTAQLEEITSHLLETGAPVVITRLHEEQALFLIERFQDHGLTYLKRARILLGKSEADALRRAEASRPARVFIVTAGTSDAPVAEEAATMVGVAGLAFERLYDVGVAGLHRLIDALPALQRAGVIVVAAGMEGALPSLVAGLVSAPVIGVPTSVGYGANLGGLTPLMAMLNSCAPGLAVVNIDNGFGAAMMAISIMRTACGDSSGEEGPEGKRG